MTSPQAPRPDRVTGLPPGVAVGPLGRRFLAYLVDGIVPAVVGLVAFRTGGQTSSGTATGTVLILLWYLVVWWMLATRAASPGMRLLKLQLVGFTDGRPTGWGRVLLRAVVLALLQATGLGLLLMLVFLLRHPRHQGWHDLAANAVVIRARVLPPRSRPPAGRPAATPVPAARPVASPAPSAADAAPAPAPSTPREPVATGPGATAVVPAPTPSQPAPRHWVAELEDGRQLVITGPVLLGRSPQPRPGEEGAELVKLSDESRTVSKTHLALDVDEHGLFVVDRDSTNGSTFTTAAGASYRCVPGQQTYVGDGTVVSIGDHRLTVRETAVERDGGQRLPR